MKAEWLLFGCSVGYLVLRRLKLKYTCQLIPYLPVQIIDGRLPTGSTNFDTTVVEVASGKDHA